MRIRRTAAEIAANIPLDQIEAHRAGEPGQQTKPLDFAVDPVELVELLRSAPWNLGHSEFAAQMIEYLIEEVTRDHPEVFKCEK